MSEVYDLDEDLFTASIRQGGICTILKRFSEISTMSVAVHICSSMALSRMIFIEKEREIMKEKRNGKQNKT